MKSEKNGFTIVELLTVLAIISILIGILLPTLSFVRNTSKNAAQKAQLATIEMTLLAFRDDNGHYPPSLSTLNGQEVPASQADYCGAQKLAEALLGWDLMGFHQRTAWRADGLDELQGDATYDPSKARDVDADGVPDTLDERTGPYLERATTNVFRLGPSSPGAADGLYRNPAPLAANTFVICDVFGAKKVKIGTGPGKTVKAGTPILYYRANPSYRTIEGPHRPQRRLYNVLDNMTLIDNGEGLRSIASGETELHPLGSRANTYEFFYDYIADPMITARPWPYRPDSYILISAGVDGLYGTKDDICNFTK